MERQLTQEQRKRLDTLNVIPDMAYARFFDRAKWIMQETGYFDDDNNGRFSLHYSPSSTEIICINSICSRLGFNRTGKASN